MSENNMILKSFDIQDELNPEIWESNSKMNDEVRNSLLKIANTFIDFLGFDIFVQDITMTGSLANYNWSKFSDIDLHILFNFQDTLEQEELFKDLFSLKKTVFNSTHDIEVKDYEVELYVQDSSEPHYSTGVYSVLFDKWVEQPEKSNFEIDKEVLLDKVECWMEKIDTLLDEEEKDQSILQKISNLQEKLKKFRSEGLEEKGEYSYENLAFKFLRRNGYIQKLFDFKNNMIDKLLSNE